MTSADRSPVTRFPAASEPNSATPMTLPVCLAVVRVPAATPERLASTLPSMAAVMAGTSRPSPRPSALSWTTIAG